MSPGLGPSASEWITGYIAGASAWALGFFLVGALGFLAKERDFAVRL